MESKGKILEKLRRYPNITVNEWDEKGLKPTSRTVESLFGSWNGAKRKAGVPEKYIHPAVVKGEKIISRTKVRDLCFKGLTDLEIAVELGCAEQTVLRIRKKLNLPSYLERWTDKIDKKRIKYIFGKLKEQPRITTREWDEKGFKPPSSAIKSYFGGWSKAKMRAGLPEKYYYHKGGRREKIPRHRIRELHSEGLTDSEIAEKLRCSSGTVAHVRRKELGLPPVWQTRVPMERVRSAYEHLSSCSKEDCGECGKSYAILRNNPIRYLGVINGWALDKFKEIQSENESGCEP